MRIALDTNIYTALTVGDLKVGAEIDRADLIILTFVVVAELRAGFAYGTRETENEIRLRKFVSGERVRVLYPDEATTREYGKLWAWLRRRGIQIPHNDIWIAALTVQHDLTLYSRDAHFDRLPQLTRV